MATFALIVISAVLISIAAGHVMRFLDNSESQMLADRMQAFAEEDARAARLREQQRFQEETWVHPNSNPSVRMRHAIVKPEELLGK